MSRKKIGWILAGLYAAAFFFSNGPGLSLIKNAPDIAGFPPLYCWAVFWFVIQFTILLTAFFLVWRDEEP